MSGFSSELNRYKAIIDSAIECCFAENKFNSTVRDAMAYAVVGAGKRVRGVLTLAVCDAVCGMPQKAVTAACALEMVHAYSLIHDDLPCMDNDDMRRGKPSCHKQYGEAVALLAGDGLLTYAFELLAGDGRADCIAVLAESAGADGMIYGQELDMSAEGRAVSQKELDLLNSCKTGALITAAVKLGLLISNADEASSKLFIEYSRLIGRAFQLRDDILDVTADESVFGKPVGSDVRDNKSTYVAVFGLDKASKELERLTDEAVATVRSFNGNSDFFINFAQYLKSRIS